MGAYEKQLSIVASLMVIVSTILEYSFGIMSDFLRDIIFIIKILLAVIVLVIILIEYNQLKKYRYNCEMIQYLFHNEGRERFNVIPKLLLYFQKIKKRNLVDIEKIDLSCRMVYQENHLITKFKWDIDGITNSSHHEISEYVFLTISDIGEIENPNITLYGQAEHNKYRITDIKESNGVYCLTWGMEHFLKPGERISKMILELVSIDSFDFNRNEIIYFYPPNYGTNIGAVNIEIETQINETIFEIEVVEVGHIKGKKGINERTILRVPVSEVGENTKKYICSISKNEINMNNLYYLLLKPL